MSLPSSMADFVPFDRLLQKAYCKSFKLEKSNAVSIGTTAVKPNLSICPVSLVWFARYCGKMYSRHLFCYGGLDSNSGIFTCTRRVSITLFKLWFTVYLIHCWKLF